MATATDSKTSLGLTPENNETIARVAFYARLTAGVLLALGSLGAGAGRDPVHRGRRTQCAMVRHPGVITLLMGLVMLAIAADLGFLASVPAYSKNHLKNGLEDLQFYFKLQLILACLWTLVLLLKLWM